MNLVKRLLCEEEGQDVIEYVLIAGGISVIAITVIASVGGSVLTRWDGLSTSLVP